MATIKDLAKETQLSLGTISNYLNGKEILPKNAEKIEAAIKRLNYIPNKFGQYLRSGDTKTIGIITNNISARYISQITADFEREFSQKGYDVIICTSNESVEVEREKIRFLISMAVNVIIIFPVFYLKSDISEFSDIDIPIILCDQPIKTCLDKYYAIVNDNERTAHDITKLLISEGHTDISCIAGDPEHYSTVTRLNGYKAALEEAGLEYKEENVYYCNNKNELSYKATLEILAKAHRSTAVLITINNMLVGFLRGVEECGLEICKDISYATFSNDSYYSLLPQKPTYVFHDTVLIGQILVNLVEKILFEPKSELNPQIIYADSKIIEGESHKLFKRS